MELTWTRSGSLDTVSGVDLDEVRFFGYSE